MTTAITTQPAAGLLANHYAAHAAFGEYAGRRSARTLTAHRGDLAAFAIFLEEAGFLRLPTVDRQAAILAHGAALQQSAAPWAGVTWGLVAGFVRWMVANGYAIGTVNRRLSTVKTYAKLAAKAGAVERSELAMIKDVSGYGHKEGRHLDAKRSRTRTGHKKAQHVRLSLADADRLKAMQPNTPQGRRDRLLLCLLLNHGLRVGELAGLERSCFSLPERRMRFYRSKVGKTQNHELNAETMAALLAYIDYGDCPVNGIIWRKSVKGGTLGAQGWSLTGISRYVRALGDAIGIAGLSPHDCRHHWATYWAGRVDAIRLQEAGGWSSLTMPRRYIEEAEIANSGMV